MDDLVDVDGKANNSSISMNIIILDKKVDDPDIAKDIADPDSRADNLNITIKNRQKQQS